MSQPSSHQSISITEEHLRTLENLYAEFLEKGAGVTTLFELHRNIKSLQQKLVFPNHVIPIQAFQGKDYTAQPAYNPPTMS